MVKCIACDSTASYLIDDFDFQCKLYNGDNSYTEKEVLETNL